MDKSTDIVSGVKYFINDKTDSDYRFNNGEKNLFTVKKYQVFSVRDITNESLPKLIERLNVLIATLEESKKGNN